LTPERVDDVIAFFDVDHVDILHVGIDWHVVFRQVVVHEATEFVGDVHG
jgi:hypothetical protein